MPHAENPDTCKLTLDETQDKLRKLGAKLSGSRARGDWHIDSDWDYYLREKQIKPLIRWLDTNAVQWYSPIVGSVTFYCIDGEQVEVSMLFPMRAPYIA